MNVGGVRIKLIIKGAQEFEFEGKKFLVNNARL